MTTTCKKPVLELLKDLVLKSKGSKSIVSKESRRCAVSVQKRLGLQSAEQAALLAVFVNMFGRNNITLDNLAKHFDIMPIELLSAMKDLQYLVDKDVIAPRKSLRGDEGYCLRSETIKALSQDRLPEPRKKTDLTMDEFMECAEELVGYIKDSDKLRNSAEINNLRRLVDMNTQLPFASKLKSMKLSDDSLVFLFVLIFENMYEGCVGIGCEELHDFMSQGGMKATMRNLAEGRDPLAKEGLVEPLCINGQVLPNKWSLTRSCCETLLADVDVKVMDNNGMFGSKRLIQPEDIKAKRLFYSKEVSAKVDKLREILKTERMECILKKLDEKGMRRCFCAILYGGPGTGKTELVLQLARETGRAIMKVDISTIRDKYVGETEKRIKRVFDEYRRLAKSGEGKAPILFFNECDALFCTRIQGFESSVDKMENAMQDIILQEMETLEGILICTTNLASNMDDAFERRFLFKINIGKPDEWARQQIWMSMLPEIDAGVAERLARSFELSGGEMENVSRKYAIDSIIECRDEVDEGLLVELCKGERYEKKSVGSVGFNV